MRMSFLFNLHKPKDPHTQKKELKYICLCLCVCVCCIFSWDCGGRRPESFGSNCCQLCCCFSCLSSCLLSVSLSVYLLSPPAPSLPVLWHFLISPKPLRACLPFRALPLTFSFCAISVATTLHVLDWVGMSCYVWVGIFMQLTNANVATHVCIWAISLPPSLSLSPRPLFFCVQLLNYIQANAIYYTLRCVPDSTQLEQAPPQHLFRFKLIKLPYTMAQIDLNVVTLCLCKYGNMTSMSWMSNGNRWHSIYVEWDVL